MATELKPAAADAVGQRVVGMIGFMGAGKSTAARGAAEALGSVVIDVDHVIEERLGKPIADIFAQDGEPAFRAAEEQITLELLTSGRPRAAARVLALGGGAVEALSVREAVSEHLVGRIAIDVE